MTREQMTLLHSYYYVTSTLENSSVSYIIIIPVTSSISQKSTEFSRSSPQSNLTQINPLMISTSFTISIIKAYLNKPHSSAHVRTCFFETSTTTTNNPILTTEILNQRWRLTYKSLTLLPSLDGHCISSTAY